MLPTNVDINIQFHTMSAKQQAVRERRNDLIRGDFNAIYMDALKIKHTSVRIMKIYEEIAKKYFLSPIQVRHIIKGYQE